MCISLLVSSIFVEYRLNHLFNFFPYIPFLSHKFKLYLMYYTFMVLATNSHLHVHVFSHQKLFKLILINVSFFIFESFAVFKSERSTNQIRFLNYSHIFQINRVLEPIPSELRINDKMDCFQVSNRNKNFDKVLKNYEQF